MSVTKRRQVVRVSRLTGGGRGGGNNGHKGGDESELHLHVERWWWSGWWCESWMRVEEDGLEDDTDVGAGSRGRLYTNCVLDLGIPALGLYRYV